MTLLTSQNPERVTLQAGKPETLPGAIVGDERANNAGAIYYLALSGLAIARYRNLPANATLQRVANKGYLGYRAAAQSLFPDSYLWLQDNRRIFRRLPIDKASGTVGPPDFNFSRRRVGIADDAEAERFCIDGHVMYVENGDGGAVRAWDISPDKLGDRASTALLPRLEKLDLDANTKRRAFDVKSLGDRRYVAERSGTDLYFDNVLVVEDYTEIDGLTAGHGAFIIVDLITRGKPRFAILSQPYAADNSGLSSAITFFDGESGDLLQQPFFVRIAGTTQQSGRDVLSDSLGVVSQPFMSVTLLRHIDESERFAVSSSSVPTESKALAVLSGMSVSRLTEAQEGVFQEVREASVEITLQNVDPNFLLNGDWHFLHDGLTFTMREMVRAGNETVAIMGVS